MKKRTLLAALLMFGFAASPVFSAGKLLDTGAGNLNKNVTVENGVISIRPEKGKKAVAFRSAYVLPSDERQKYFRLSFSCRFPETPKTELSPLPNLCLLRSYNSVSFGLSETPKTGL